MYRGIFVREVGVEEEDRRFTVLYEEGFAPMYKAALMLCGNRDLAEDATQEAFARALERWDRIGGEPWAVGWVMTTALNYARRAQARPGRFIVGNEVTPDTDAALDLWNGVRALPRRQQEAVALHYIADLPLDQVAAVMGCENGTVKAHLWRARHELARHLGRDDDATR